MRSDDASTRGLPDPMHPGIRKQWVDGLVHAQIILDSYVSDDPGDVEAARAALRLTKPES